MFRVAGKEVLVEGVKKGTFTITPQSDGDRSGSFLPLPVVGTAAVGGRGCVKDPLTFVMAGCKNPTGAVGGGGGAINAGQARAKNGTPYFVVGDTGSCTGALLGTPAQKPGPCNCKFEITSSGQAGGPAPPAAQAEAEEKNKDGRLEILYLDAAGKPISGAKCTITTADGETLRNAQPLDGGRAVVTGNPKAPRVVTVSLFGDPKFEVHPDHESIKNPLRPLTPAPTKFPAPTADEPPPEWGTPPAALSFKDWVYGVAIGDFNPAATIDQTVARTIVTLIPFVDQIADLQDLSAAVYFLVWKGQHNDPLQWIGLTITLVGCVPELGSAMKGALTILRRAVGDKLPQIVRFLNWFGTGHAIKWLRLMKQRLVQMADKMADLFVKVLKAIQKKLSLVAKFLKERMKSLAAVIAKAGEKIREACRTLADELEECLRGSKKFEEQVVTGRTYKVRQQRSARGPRPKAERARLPRRRKVKTKGEPGEVLTDAGKYKPVPPTLKQMRTLKEYQVKRNRILKKWREREEDLRRIDPRVRQQVDKTMRGVKKNAKPDDLAGAMKERGGNMTPNPNKPGKDYDHVKEVQQTRDTLKQPRVEGRSHHEALPSKNYEALGSEQAVAKRMNDLLKQGKQGTREYQTLKDLKQDLETIRQYLDGALKK